MSKISYAPVLEMIRNGKPRSEIIAHIKEKYFVGNSRAGEIYRTEYAKTEKLEFSDKFTYNKETDKYVIPLKCRRDPLVISGARHRAICRDYSSWNGDLTANEVCIKFSLTPEIFSEYRRIFNLTKDREPLSAEEVWDNSEDDSVESILEQKRYSIYQKFEKADWHETQKDADKWRAFQSNQIDPFLAALDTWTPPKYTKITPPKNLGILSEQVALINVNDIHVGAKADERFLYRQRNWRHSDLQESMADYCKKIRKEIYSRTNGPRECILNLIGDLLHTLSGFTDAGTKLESEFISEDQIDFAMTLMVAFINETLTTFSKVYIKAVGGNHSFLGDYVLAKLLETYYRKESRISFEITSKRYLPYKVLDTLVIIDHGASGRGIKAKTPRSGPARDSHIKSILLDRPDLLVGTKTKLYIQGDLHHYEHVERADFDYIICPSIVAGDQYSDYNAWKSRPAQQVFIIDRDGLKESIRFYFD